jgi:Fe-S cluster assembly protein SufD
MSMPSPPTASAPAASAERHPSAFNRDAFEAFLTTRNEPGWITDLRRKAFEVYSQKATSPLDPEEFKRIDLRAFRADDYRLLAPANATPPAEFATLLADRARFVGEVTHVNGRTSRVTLDEGLTKQGVLFGDLAALARDHREIFEPRLMTLAVRPQTDRFSAWHAAFWTGGTVLYVPRRVHIEEPLHSLIGLSEPNAADFSHTLVILEEESSATLLEETASARADMTGLHVGAVELLLGPHSQLRYVQLQNWSPRTYHFAHQAGHVDRSARLQWTVGGLGSRLAHIHQHVSLDGAGAEAQVNGVTFATDRQHISYYTQQTHRAPSTTSDLLYKEVLRDKARVTWRGMIKVEKAAQKTDGYQRSDALLLSSTARCDSIPGLEIEADDVRCTHGATAGRVDEEQIFYCMCRGLSRFEAMHLIVEGFFHSVYDRIPVEAVRETLSKTVERKLGIGR